MRNCPLAVEGARKLDGVPQANEGSKQKDANEHKEGIQLVSVDVRRETQVRACDRRPSLKPGNKRLSVDDYQ